MERNFMMENPSRTENATRIVCRHTFIIKVKDRENLFYGEYFCIIVYKKYCMKKISKDGEDF